MPFHRIVDIFPNIPPLDPIWLVLFSGAFCVSALVTLRRTGYGAVVLALVAPFGFAHEVVGTTVTLQKVALLGVVLGVAAAPGAWAALRQKSVATVVAAFLAVVAVNALTIVVAHHRADALRESLKWCEYLAFLLAVLIAYILDPEPRAVRAALGISIVVVACSAIAELFTGARSGIWIANIAYPRIAGFLDGPNQLGGYLEVAIAAIGAWQVRDPRPSRALLLLLLGFTLLLTFSRGAAVGTVVVLAVIAIIERGRAVRLWPLLAGVALGYAQVVVWGASSAVLRTGGGDEATAGGVGTRSELWRAAWFFFRHHPILGIGAGNYALELPQAGLYGVRTQANSWYLQALAEGGVLLFTATVAWVAVIVRLTLRAVRVSPWGLAAFAATCALALHGVTDDLTFYPKVAEPWIVLIALGIAAGPEPQ